MPRLCTICASDHHEAIDRALVTDSASNRRIAARYGLSEQAVRRHRADHLPASLVKAVEAETIAEAGSLLSQVEMLRDRSLALLDKAEDAGDLRTALAAIREARTTIELLLEVEGELDRRGVVNIELSADWVQVRAVLLDALAPYADARQAVAGALVAIEGGKRDVG